MVISIMIIIVINTNNKKRNNNTTNIINTDNKKKKYIYIYVCVRVFSLSHMLFSIYYVPYTLGSWNICVVCWGTSRPSRGGGGLAPGFQTSGGESQGLRQEIGGMLQTQRPRGYETLVVLTDNMVYYNLIYICIITWYDIYIYILPYGILQGQHCFYDHIGV